MSGSTTTRSSHWHIPRLWQGKRAFILAGGPSAAGHIHKLKGWPLIAVNSSWTVAPFADFLFFADVRWWHQYWRDVLVGFHGHIVTTGDCRHERLLRVQKVSPPQIQLDQETVTMRRTSVTGAIVLAAKLGATEVVLVGADGRLSAGGRRHNHAVTYPWALRPDSYQGHAAELEAVAPYLKAMGVQVLNASPNSLYTAFPQVDIDECLKGEKPVLKKLAVNIPERSGEALSRFIDMLPAGARVLDVGSGQCEYAAALREAGMNVVTLDIAHPADIQGDFMDPAVLANEQGDRGHGFDGVWVSHVLEHQLNVNAFLQKVRRCTKPGGLIAITVPPLKHAIVGGHVTVWNAGLLLYNMILAGLDCSAARVGTYSYNISALAKRIDAVLPSLHYDQGDIELLAPFFPTRVKQGFNGQLPNLNW